MFQPATLDRRKFQDPEITADGQTRGRVALTRLETLWFNTGTLCNLACKTCYIESSPVNDALVYLTTDEVSAYLDEIETLGLGTRSIGLTGGEPFMNPDGLAIMEACLARGYNLLVLTNAMRPMTRWGDRLLDIARRHRETLTIRVSLDHYTAALHEAERGPDSFAPALEGMVWLARAGVRLHVAGRMFSGEDDAALRRGFGALFAAHDLPIDPADREALTLFPEMDESIDVPEITEACWGILNKSPDDVMCATSRMVVKRKGADRPSVISCTLLPYADGFDLGPTLGGALGTVRLNHPHCATFCVLGGASCGG